MERTAVVVRSQHGGGSELQVLRQLPPGFRFHPTDEELVVQYLRRKALGLPLPAAVIPDLPLLHSLDPWDIPAASDGEKYFFAVRPAAGAGRCGRRPAAATRTASGCWRPAGGGRERPIVAASTSRCGGSLLHLVGVKRSMVFVLRRKKGKAPPPPAATDWVMHEYRLALPPHYRKNGEAQGSQEWVVCRISQRSRPRHGGRRAPPPVMAAASPASSSSSCVTSSSDQEEDVSGGGHKHEASS